MAISSRAGKFPLLPVERFIRVLKGRSPQTPPALLVFRVPGFAREAWRRGKRAARQLERDTAEVFGAACSRTLRAGDCIAHDIASEVFAIALCSSSRDGRTRSAVDCRAVLERVALALALGVDLRIETGWSVLKEIGDRASLESAIERALERGARERERHEFFAAVGHELRTPLTSIRGYLETLLDDAVDETTSRRFLQTARREALRMGRLIEGMVEFSLLDLSAERLLGHTCGLRSRLDEACDVVRPIAAARGITLERAPCADVSVAIEGDAFVQMLVNILDNAVKYGNGGGRIAVGAHVSGNEVTIGIDDDGPGVGAAESESIFGLRVRGERHEQWSGSGIGLAIVKIIADRAGGRVSCGASALGGARFEIVLPAGAESAVPVS